VNDDRDAITVIGTVHTRLATIFFKPKQSCRLNMLASPTASILAV